MDDVASGGIERSGADEDLESRFSAEAGKRVGELHGR
jgi:hypothetical protein